MKKKKISKRRKAVSAADFKNIDNLAEHLYKQLGNVTVTCGEGRQVIIYTGVRATRTGRLVQLNTD